MLKNIFFRIILLLYINYCFSIIVLPIEILPRENYKLIYDINSPQDIMDEESRKAFFTTFEIGCPVQKIPLLIKPKKNFYTITSVYPVVNTTIDKNYRKFNFSDNFFKQYDFYDENRSNSSIINWCRESEYYIAEECCSVNDNILIYKNPNMTNKNIININFELMRNVEDNITGEIGMNLYDEVGRTYDTFLGVLKANNLINNYNWYFDFDSYKDQKGKIVIGSLPHYDYPNLYSEDDLVNTSSIQLSRFSFMEMVFDKVYIIDTNKNKIEFSGEAEINYDSNNLIGTRKYEKYLLTKLDNLLKEKICFNDKIRDFEYYNNFTFYYCKNEKDIKEKLNNIFSTIYFFSYNLNNTFKINNNEIFFEKGNYIYIRILFNDIVNKWSLGKLFSLKHKFVFNQESKQISFYRKLKSEKKNSRNYSLFIKVIIVIVLSIILFVLGIKLGKILNKSRKARANELLDDYEYDSIVNNQNKYNINNDNNNINDGNIN